MGIPIGEVVYSLGTAPCSGVGLAWTRSDLDQAMRSSVQSVLFDDEGRLSLEELLTGMADTEFAQEGVQNVLSTRTPVEDWRVGEAIAESYLLEYRACTFPWPDSRDERIAGSSLPGADLVGFGEDEKGTCLAFGEVKTSGDRNHPPAIMYGPTGFKAQLERLRDWESVRDELFKYLAYRAGSASWSSLFETAGRRYLQNKADVQIYGLLIRDVDPQESDLRALVMTLTTDRPAKTVIELLAIYLPRQSIQGLGKVVTESRAKGDA